MSRTPGPDDERRLPDDVFNDALELTTHERQSYLDAVCAGDPDLRREVDSLLEIAEANPGLGLFPDGVAVPERIGRYRILQRCGEGGMGVVYKAEDPAIQFVVALKVLSSPRLPRLDMTRWMSEAQARLQEEARCLAQLDHPSIARLHALECDDGGVPYLVMEFVDGETVADLLARGIASTPLGDPTSRFRVCIDIASGIEAAHERRIIHRDLKPGNIMVTHTGQVRILDFGIAKMMELSQRAEDATHGDRARASSPTRVGGTPGYMSPEQERGESVDHRTDIWAFGRILQDLMGGSSDRLPAPIANRLKRLRLRCLEDTPAHRPATMTEVRRELERTRDSLARWTAIRRYGTLAAAGTAILTAALIVYPRGAVPESVTPDGRAIEVLYSDGGVKHFLPPDSIRAEPDAAWLVDAGSSPQHRLVIALTGRTGKTESHLLFWNRRARLVACLPTTWDAPFPEGGGAAQGHHREKRFTFLFPPSKKSPRLTALEYSNYYTCVLRMFDLTGRKPREVYRLYHAGHINDRVTFTNGLDGGTWMWVSGVAALDATVLEAVGGTPMRTYFLACFDAASEGTGIFPPWTRPDAGFLAGHNWPVHAATPILYFLLTAHGVNADRIDREAPQSVWVDKVYDSESGLLGLLLSTTLRFDFRRAGDSEIGLDLSVTGDLHQLLARRAEQQGTSVDSIQVRFLADSVVALAALRDGYRLTGEFRDIRSVLPPSGAGWADVTSDSRHD